MKKNEKFFTVYVLLVCVLVMVLHTASAWAIPSLDVIPDFGEFGVYYDTPDHSFNDFIDEHAPYDGNAVFMLSASGKSLSGWYGEDSRKTDLDKIISMSTNSAAEHNITFDRINFEQLISVQNQIGGYREQLDEGSNSTCTFYGVNLGTINNNNAWEELDAGWPLTWYLYTGITEYSSFQPYQQDWMFAICAKDLGGIYESLDKLKDGEFSPKTISSNVTVPVPESATMLLLGAGLIGLAGFGRKKFLGGREKPAAIKPIFY